MPGPCVNLPRLPFHAHLPEFPRQRTERRCVKRNALQAVRSRSHQRCSGRSTATAAIALSLAAFLWGKFLTSSGVHDGLWEGMALPTVAGAQVSGRAVGRQASGLTTELDTRGRYVQEAAYSLLHAVVSDGEEDWEDAAGPADFQGDTGRLDFL